MQEKLKIAQNLYTKQPFFFYAQILEYKKI